MEYNIHNNIDKWNYETLLKLSKIGSIEGSYFEIKGKDKINGDLSKTICSLANSYGGVIIFGIDENKQEKNPLKRFRLNGFKESEEDKDTVSQKIANQIYQVDPPPLTITKCIDDKHNTDVYYVALQIKNEDQKKPFFTKNFCYIRIENTSKPAPRSIILSMVQSQIIPYDIKDKHKDYILKIFEKLKFLQLRELTGKDKITLVVPIRPCEYERKSQGVYDGTVDEKITDFDFEDVFWTNHLDWALSHLKDESYNNIYENFILIKNKINNSSSSDIGIQKLNNEIREPLADFTKCIHYIVNDLNAGDQLRGHCKLGY
jgi:hypothetical protein